MDLFDHLARLNLAAYLMDRTGTQIDFDNVDTTPGSPTLNLHTEETRQRPGQLEDQGHRSGSYDQAAPQPHPGRVILLHARQNPADPEPVHLRDPPFQVFAVYTPKHAASAFDRL